MTPANDRYDNCLPEAGANEAPEPQPANEHFYTLSAANPQTKKSITTMYDSMAGPSKTSRSYLSPQVLQPIPRLKKTVSNRRKKSHQMCDFDIFTLKARFSNIDMKDGRNRSSGKKYR
ncbi:hypothetical protein JTB14_000481 [Gonioctena quinquepunctata]|nr:hypothetical protein JTB14_000481 [Gonioctena quinquepunctata]